MISTRPGRNSRTTVLRVLADVLGDVLGDLVLAVLADAPVALVALVALVEQLIHHESYSSVTSDIASGSKVVHCDI